MEKRQAGQLGRQIARTLASYMASEAHTNTRGWSDIDSDLRNAIVDVWSGMVADMLLKQLPESSEDLNELLTALGESRGFGPLVTRALRLWAGLDPLKHGVPFTLGPTPDNTVDCGCAGGDEGDLCPWCEGCGLLTRRVRRVKDALESGLTVVMDGSGEPTTSVMVTASERRESDLEEAYADLHRVYEMLMLGRQQGVRRARFKSRGGAEIEVQMDEVKP